jgi:hypothetical protein
MPIIFGREDERRQEFVEQGILALRRHKFDAIILDKNHFTPFDEALSLYYQREPGLLIGEKDLFRTVTGMRIQPCHLYLPRAD